MAITPINPASVEIGPRGAGIWRVAVAFSYSIAAPSPGQTTRFFLQRDRAGSGFLDLGPELARLEQESPSPISGITQTALGINATVQVGDKYRIVVRHTSTQTITLFATDTGDHRFDHLLPVFSEAGVQDWIAQLSGFIRRLENLSRSQLPPGDQLNYEIFDRLLRNEQKFLGFGTYRMPVSNTGGFHIYFPDLPGLAPLGSLQDYEHYLARLRAFSTLC